MRRPSRHDSARCELLLPRVAPGERWWGGCVARGCEQPYGEDTHPWTLALGDTGYNQVRSPYHLTS
jgi:hypothetical protein